MDRAACQAIVMGLQKVGHDGVTNTPNLKYVTT